MRLADIQSLVAQGKGFNIEFKLTTGELRQGLETICGFLNSGGGRVLFGVDRNEPSPIGWTRYCDVLGGEFPGLPG